MLPNQWYPILFCQALLQKPVPVRRGGLDLVLFRDERGVARCLRDRCPHRGVPLSLGRVKDGRLACGYHGFEFTGDGSCVHMPCAGRGARIPAGMTTDAFPVHEKDGIIWLFWGQSSLADAAQIPFLESAREFGGESYDSVLEWPLHYANSLENNFDIHHFNYVHVTARVIARAGTQIVENEVLKLPNGLRYRAAIGSGSDEPGSKKESFEVEYRMPSLQSIRFKHRNLVTVYDSPIDAKNTHRMLRMYHRGAPTPGIGKLVVRLFSLFAGRYAQIHEDLPFAKHVAPPGYDRPIAADAGIQAYRKLRHNTLRAALELDLPAHVRASMGWDGLLDREVTQV